VPPPQIDPIRQIHMLQRHDGKVGKKLGKTTGWIHRESLRKNQVEFYTGVSYDKIDDNGLHYIKNNTANVLDVDNIIICAGQESHTYLATQLKNQNYHKIHIIGGALMARELDAKFAIENGMKLGLSL
jgi:2,4-dienoyl-CoA reductase (NADPH2)